MIHFLGSSHAATFLHEAALRRGIQTTFNIQYANLIFVSEDTPTDENGVRDLSRIINLIDLAKRMNKPIVLTSQVPPGFTRTLGIEQIHHQAETLRIKDAKERALNPEYIAVGGEAEISPAYQDYLEAFQCPILRMSWEEAEMSKIAVNMMLAAQVEATNYLSAACAKVGADWAKVSQAIAHDKRIGPHAYLTPGRWQDSKHLLRDHVTLEEISTR